MRGRASEWLGAVARLIVYAAALVVLTMLFGAIWNALPDSLHDVPLLETLAVAVAALLAGVFVLRIADGRRAAALGIAVSREAVRHVLFGILVGGAGLVAAALALLATGSLEYVLQPGDARSWIDVVALQASLFTVAALMEEAVFRGYVFQVLARQGGPIAATVVTSLLFAAAHGRNPSVDVFALVNIFLAGIMLAIAYLRTLSLWFATAVHMGWNWTMATLFDLPVSGLTMFDTPLYEPIVEGPSWWSGAEFGPEGGLVGTLGFAVVLLLVVKWRAIRPDPAIVEARPLVLNEGEVHAG